jgi:uncharacterized protein YndB with AHSA1/START domain
VEPVSASTTLQRPATEVFAYLVDIANHPALFDHYTEDWRLTREDTVGKGAGARFTVRQWGNRFPWVDQTFYEVEPPRKIVAVGRGGKFNRIRIVTEFLIDATASDACRVTITQETVPVMPSDHLLEFVWGVRGRTIRRLRKAVGKLEDLLEPGSDAARKAKRATIAGGARKPATGAPLR